MTGTGALFQEDAKQAFTRITGQRFTSMMERLLKKKLIEAKRYPFTKDEFRDDLLVTMGGHHDGFVRCRYCQDIVIWPRSPPTMPYRSTAAGLWDWQISSTSAIPAITGKARCFLRSTRLWSGFSKRSCQWLELMS